MDLTKAVVLGVVQGLTEFLPVSSSGHLVLANRFLFGGEALPLWVDSNTGTFLAAALLMRREIASALAGFLRGLLSPAGRREPGWRLFWLVVVASLPAAVVGLLVKEHFELVNRPFYVALGLLFTALVLWTTPKGGAKARPEEVSFREAFLGGLAQALAIWPGVSRSGTTISAFLRLGLAPEFAARLSFLMYAAASLGVLLLGLKDGLPPGVEPLPVLAMVAASFLSGYLAMLLLFGVLKAGKFRLFAPYVAALAVLTLATHALG